MFLLSPNQLYLCTQNLMNTMNVNKILPFVLLLPFLASCTQ